MNRTLTEKLRVAFRLGEESVRRNGGSSRATCEQIDREVAEVILAHEPRPRIVIYCEVGLGKSVLLDPPDILEQFSDLKVGGRFGNAKVSDFIDR